MLHDLGYIDFTEPFTRAAQPGHGRHDGSSDEQVARQPACDLSDELAIHGVDAVRLTMVFAGPPEDDIDWADVSPTGSGKFLARAWRLAGDVTSAPGTDPATGDAALRGDHAPLHRRDRLAGRGVPVQRRRRPDDGAGQRHPQGDRLRRGRHDPAVREAAEAVAIMLSLVAPYTAEEMWAAWATALRWRCAGWPVVDPALLVRRR